MSETNVVSVTSEANSADFWKIGLTSDQQKSYKKVQETEMAIEAARYKISKDWAVTCSSIAALGIVIITCVAVIAFRENTQANHQAWTIISGTISGAFSYLAGKASKSEG